MIFDNKPGFNTETQPVARTGAHFQTEKCLWQIVNVKICKKQYGEEKTKKMVPLKTYQA